MGAIFLRETIDTEFAWDFFENTGSIESYMIYNEYKNTAMGIKKDEYNTNIGTCAENL